MLLPVKVNPTNLIFLQIFRLYGMQHSVGKNYANEAQCRVEMEKEYRISSKNSAPLFFSESLPKLE